MALLAMVFFFELGDINSFSYAAPMLKAHWGITANEVGKLYLFFVFLCRRFARQ
jgi:hypothetical protein